MFLKINKSTWLMGQILNLQKLLPPAVESSYSESPFMPVNKRELGTQPGCWSKRGTRPLGAGAAHLRRTADGGCILTLSRCSLRFGNGLLEGPPGGGPLNNNAPPISVSGISVPERSLGDILWPCAPLCPSPHC